MLVNTPESMMSEEKKATDGPPADVPVVTHSDNEKSALPERDDDGRQSAPNDPPGQGEGEEPPVG